MARGLDRKRRCEGMAGDEVLIGGAHGFICSSWRNDGTPLPVGFCGGGADCSMMI